jgi:hypothetical protein
MLKAPVVILTRGADNKTMFEETRTITVNIHGAMIRQSRMVKKFVLVAALSQKSLLCAR